jgi:hypothetical protein
VPSLIEPVPRELLQELAGTVKDPDPPRSGASAGGGYFDIEAFISRYLWVRWTLREPTLASDVYKHAEEMGISAITVRRAAATLNVRKRKTSPEGRWMWSLPDEQDGQDAQGDQDDHDSQPEGNLSTLPDHAPRCSLKARPPVPHEGGRKWVLEFCPFNRDHRASDAAVFQRADRSLGFRCLHNSCSDKHWRHVRELYEGPRQQAHAEADARPADEQEPQAGTLLVRPVSEIETRQLEWLWRQRIPRGKISLLVGNPGLGKTLLTAGIVATVTTGGLWPVSGDSAAPGNVVFVSAEDDVADTLRPRFEAAGADLNRVYVLQGVIAAYTTEGRVRPRMFDLQRDLEGLRRKLTEIDNVAAVIIDPISAFLGDVDSHRNDQIRAVRGSSVRACRREPGCLRGNLPSE